MSKKICIFGDSVTQGYHDLEKGGWIERLNLYLWSKDLDFSVFNLGVSGDTSFDLLERIENEIKAREAKSIIINIGANDAGVEKGKSRTDLKTFEENFNKILEISQKFTSEIVFVGILNVNEKFSAPVNWDENLFYYNEELEKYNLVIEKFCQEEKIIFIPMQGTLNDENLPDGVHPNAEGHEKIFQRIKDYLEESKII